ncbi:MAG: amidase family protein [Chloroflexi bacterium]|nr:amidase family protein [Chloroflexota bacterium]
MNDTLWTRDATGQAALLHSGEVRPAELVEIALARIAALNPRINAVVTVLENEARRQAVDPALSARQFGGVPLLLKDAVQELAGTPYMLGTRLLAALGWRSQHTTEFTRRLMNAGFVIIGKTNLPELSSGFTTEPEGFGPTHNPWDLARTAGGSSGGSAAAVAAGLTAVAHGGDATGSLRVPASACGVATLKPSRGVIPHATPAAQPDPLGVWCDFVTARSVRDLTAILAAVRNPGGSTAPAPSGAPLRAGLLLHDPFSGAAVHPACVEAVERTGAALQRLGYAVEYAAPPEYEGLFGRIGRDLGVVSAYGRAAQVRWLTALAGRKLVAAAAARVHAAVAPLLQWHRSGYALLVTPTLRQPPWPLGGPNDASQSGLFTFPASLTGQPAVSLPLHQTDDGLPVGVQIMADLGQDEALLALAAQLEEALPWRHRWPPIARAI